MNDTAPKIKKLDLTGIKQKKGGKRVEDVDPDTSSFLLLTDGEIAMVLASRAKRLRIEQQKKQSDIAAIGNFNPKTYAAFEQDGGISLERFIKTVRALGRLEELEGLLARTVSETLAEIEKKPKKVRKRVV